jgi:uncharacterized membrane protein YhaH (DUF805 family)
MEYMWMPLRRYADFSGRSRRKEYWLFNLGVVLTYTVLLIVSFASSGPDGEPGAVFGLVGLLFVGIWLALIIPSLAVLIRRLHDQERSGWFILLAFVPVIGGLVLLVFTLLPGTPGENRYGADPRGNEHQAVFG